MLLSHEKTGKIEISHVKPDIMFQEERTYNIHSFSIRSSHDSIYKRDIPRLKDVIPWKPQLAY